MLFAFDKPRGDSRRHAFGIQFGNMKRNSSETALAPAPTRKLACIRPKPLAELQAKTGNDSLILQENTTQTSQTTSLISTPNHQVGTLTTKMMSFTHRSIDAISTTTTERSSSSSATLLLLRPVLVRHPLLLVVGAPKQVITGVGVGNLRTAVNIGQPLGPLVQQSTMSTQHNKVVQQVVGQQNTTTVIQTKTDRPRITEVSIDSSDEESVAEP